MDRGWIHSKEAPVVNEGGMGQHSLRGGGDRLRATPFVAGSIKANSICALLNATRTGLEWHLETTQNAKTLNNHSFLQALGWTNDEQKVGLSIQTLIAIAPRKKTGYHKVTAPVKNSQNTEPAMNSFRAKEN
jgi:hypothetical protein